MSYFQDAEVEFEGRILRFSAEEGQALESRGNYWHGPGDPSSWLGAAVVLKAREKTKDAPKNVTLKLATDVMGMDIERLRSLIKWHEDYMRWHDGDPNYKVL